MTRSLAHRLAPALVAAVALAGCGTGDAAPQQPAATAPEAAAAASGGGGGASGNASGGDRKGGAAPRAGDAAGGGSDRGAGRRGGAGGDGAKPAPGGGDSARGGRAGRSDRARSGRGRSDRSPAGGGSGRSRPGDGGSQGSGPASPSRERELRAFIEDYVARYSRGDASICTEVFTQRHVEQLTKHRGDAAIAKCRTDVSRNKTTFRLVKLESVRELSARRWRATATLAVGNRGYRSLLEIVEDGGRLRIDGAG